MTIALEDVAVPRQILVVEDEENTRRVLAELLERRGFEVMLAANGPTAILLARQRDIGVVLMDIVFEPGEMDGIEAAREIQREFPLTSFIFTTAFAQDPEYAERIALSGVRIGGVLEKPIQIDELTRRIEKELEKLRLLARLEEARERGDDPFAHLAVIEESLSPELFTSLLAELRAGDLAETVEILPLPRSENEGPLMQIAAEIDQVYSEICSLVAQGAAGGGSLKEALRPLRARLESLQEQEADAMERRFRSRLEFDPRQGRRLVESAEELLGRR